MTPKTTASIEEIGNRLRQASRRLFRRPALEELREVFRDLTTMPIVRFSESLEPLCGAYEPVEPRSSSDENLHQANVDSDNPPTAQQFIDASETRTSPPASSSGHASAPDVARVFRAMKVLNLHDAGLRSRRAAVGHEAQQPARQATAKSAPVEKLSTPAIDEQSRTPIADRTDHNRNPQPVEERQSAGGLSAQMPWTSKPRRVEHGGADTRVAGVRMAQGAPGIAALLQAHLAGHDRRVELVQPPENGLAIDSDATAGHPQPDDNAVDMDLLTEKLAERLEFELMRIYGRSPR